MGFNFPYGNKQQLNLDWFLRKFKELVAAWNDKEESIDGALDAEIQKAEDALSDVYTARDVTVAAKNDALQAKADALTAAANAAQYWQNAAASANSAATSAVTALQAAQVADADAQQTAADRAAVAQDKATVAQDKAAVAADKATVAQDKADTDDIKDAANAAALRSEGWSDGTQNGTPVTSESPYYENNAKYYKEAAEDVLDSIPPDYSDLVAEVASQSEKIAPVTKNAFIQPTYYDMLHAGDMPLTRMASRDISVTGNRIYQKYASGSAAHVFINLIGNSGRVGGNIEPPELPVTADMLDTVSNISSGITTIRSYRKATSLAGTIHVSIAVIYYALIDDIYTYIGLQELNIGGIGAGNFNSMTLYVPTNATHYGLFYYSATSTPTFDAIFEFDSATTVQFLGKPLTDFTADAALSANDFRIVGNTLYKITASIASGGTLTPGTNCKATTICEELTAILNL